MSTTGAFGSTEAAVPLLVTGGPCAVTGRVATDRSGYRCPGWSTVMGAPLVVRAFCSSRRPSSIKRRRSSVAGLDEVRDARSIVCPLSRSRDRSGDVAVAVEGEGPAVVVDVVTVSLDDRSFGGA